MTDRNLEKESVGTGQELQHPTELPKIRDQNQAGGSDLASRGGTADITVLDKGIKVAFCYLLIRLGFDRAQITKHLIAQISADKAPAPGLR